LIAVLATPAFSKMTSAMSLPISKSALDPAGPSGVIRLLVVDDHPLYRHGLTRYLGDLPDFEVVGEASTSQGALDVMRTLQPDVAILDISLPGSDGIELIKLMLSEHPRMHVLVLSMHEETLYALRALRAGAKGYVMKQDTATQVAEALRKVVAGGIYVSPRFAERLVFQAIHASEWDFGSPVDKLSDRELEVLRLFGRGLGTRKVADSLHLSVKTIETHRSHIKEKLGFKTAEELVQFAVDWVATEEK
jgi:DNA-binding NarL/FixJ family response regulator